MQRKDLIVLPCSALSPFRSQYKEINVVRPTVTFSMRGGYQRSKAFRDANDTALSVEFLALQKGKGNIRRQVNKNVFYEL